MLEFKLIHVTKRDPSTALFWCPYIGRDPNSTKNFESHQSKGFESHKTQRTSLLQYMYKIYKFRSQYGACYLATVGITIPVPYHRIEVNATHLKTGYQ